MDSSRKVALGTPQPVLVLDQMPEELVVVKSEWLEQSILGPRASLGQNGPREWIQLTDHPL